MSATTSLTLKENEVEVLRAVLRQVYYKVDTKELGKKLGAITANAASKRFKRVYDRVLGPQAKGKQGASAKMASFDDAAKKGKHNGDEVKGFEVDSMPSEAKKVAKTGLGKKENAKNEPVEEDEALEPAMKEEVEDADQA